MASSFLAVLILGTSLWTADGFMEYQMDSCDFNSTELSGIEYTRSLYFNKHEYARFSSSLGEFVGFDEFGIYNAKIWNKDQGQLSAMRAQKETYCKHNIEIDYSNMLTKSVKPSVTLSSSTPSAGKHQAMLVCSVYGFYPKHITVSWLRNGQTHSSDVTSTEELPDGDWYYQVHSHLEYTPRSGEKISCKVEHASLSSPLVTDWDPSMPEAQRNQIAIGASGLILGLILSLAGFIYYKRKAGGRILVPSS